MLTQMALLDFMPLFTKLPWTTQMVAPFLKWSSKIRPIWLSLILWYWELVFTQRMHHSSMFWQKIIWRRWQIRLDRSQVSVQAAFTSWENRRNQCRTCSEHQRASLWWSCFLRQPKRQKTHFWLLSSKFWAKMHLVLRNAPKNLQQCELCAKLSLARSWEQNS